MTSIPLNDHTFAAIIALEYSSNNDDHAEFPYSDDPDEFSQILADDLDDLYHNANFEIFSHYFDCDDDSLYAMLTRDDAIIDLAAAIIIASKTRPDPFLAFRAAN